MTVPIKISRILHAGYIFECEGVQIVCDPIFENPFSRNCYAFPDVSFDSQQIRALHLAAVFISHFHDDHCSLESLELIHRQTPIYIYCVFDEMAAMIRELGFKNVRQLEIDQPIHLGPFSVTCRRALDADVDSLLQVQAGGLNVLNVVDSWIDEPTLKQLSHIPRWDMILWPFQTMREIEVLAPTRADRNSNPSALPPEWLPQLQVLKPRYIVPSSCQFIHESWSWYNHALFPITYQRFQREIATALPEAQVVRMNPGVSFRLETNSLSPAPALEWIVPIGEQNVDYDFHIEQKPPHTQEIARRFPALSPAQRETVLRFCQIGLLHKFRTLDPPSDPYFQQPRRWRLTLYDRVQGSLHFDYKVMRDQIEPAGDQEHVLPLGWRTEVPSFKLHAALTQGESLSSMYLRINDQVFCDEIETEIGSADVAEDPLIRCLFHAVFGAYQIDQLRKLRLR